MRTIAVPQDIVDLLRSHHRQQIEHRLKLGLGRPEGADLIFPLVDGAVVRDRKLPTIMFHALRHTHASALIAAGVDIAAISKRLGHASPAITLAVYTHLFDNKGDAAAAQAIGAVLGGKLQK